MFSCVAHVGFVLGLAYLFSSLVFNFIFYPKPYSLTYLHWLCCSGVFVLGLLVLITHIQFHLENLATSNSMHELLNLDLLFSH
jgi:hypothetical protein